MSKEKGSGNIGERVKTVEDAIVLLTKLVSNHDDRLYDSLKEDENLNAKISALVDAQIRNETKLDKMIESIKIAHSRLDHLESI